jgi:hypothetical protein
MFGKAAAMSPTQSLVLEPFPNVGGWEPETRINSLQTALSARRLGFNGGEKGPKPGYGPTPRPP